MSEKGQLGKKLDEIKQCLYELISDKVRIQKQNNTMVIKSHENKYAKKGDLEKENMVLAYEVKLLASLIARLEINQADGIFKLNQSICNNEIKSRQNIKELEARAEKLQLQVERLENNKKELQKKLETWSKNAKIWQKKCSQYQKIGGMAKINKNKQNIKELTNLNMTVQQQNIVYKEQIKKLKQKCIILEQLNRQTDEKLSEMMIANINGKKNGDRINTIDYQENTVKIGEKNNYKLELLAAKQEIRMLKLKIDNLEKQKTNQKMKYEEKESIYEKMVMKGIRI